MDMASFEKFQENTVAHLNSVISVNVDEFVDDLMSYWSLWAAVKDLTFTNDSQKKRVEELWDKHFNAPIQKVVDQRVGMLIDDIDAHNRDFMSQLRKEGKDIDQFDKEIRNELIRRMNNRGLYLSQQSVNKANINSIVSFGIGSGLALGVSKLLKAGVWTTILGIGIDIIASSAIDQTFKVKMKNQLKNEITSSLNTILNNDNGFFKKINNHISEFHQIRKEKLKNI